MISLSVSFKYCAARIRVGIVIARRRNADVAILLKRVLGEAENNNESSLFFRKMRKNSRDLRIKLKIRLRYPIRSGMTVFVFSGFFLFMSTLSHEITTSELSALPRDDSTLSHAITTSPAASRNDSAFLFLIRLSSSVQDCCLAREKT